MGYSRCRGGGGGGFEKRNTSIQTPALTYSIQKSVVSPSHSSSTLSHVSSVATGKKHDRKLFQFTPWRPTGRAGMYTFLVVLWHYRLLWTLASSFRSFLTNMFLMDFDGENHRISFCLGHHLWPIWHGSYAAACIALRIIWPRKPHHYAKVRIPWA